MKILSGKSMKSKVIHIVSLPLLFSLSGYASASLTACSTSVADDVTGAMECQISSEKQDFISSPLTVNTEEFFSLSNWEFAGKDNHSGSSTWTHETGNIDIGLDINGNGQSGTWAIDSSAWNNWDSIMLVFKDGKDTTITGYLLEDSVYSGTWVTPFHTPDFNVKNPKDVSHVSVYVSGAHEVTVPAPTPIFLLALGLMLISRFSARRQTGNSLIKI